MTRVVVDARLTLGSAPDARTLVEVEAPDGYRLDLSTDATQTSGGAHVAVEGDGPVRALVRFLRG